MTLKELTRIFDNDTNIQIDFLGLNKGKTIYKGQIYGYSGEIKNKYPDDDYLNMQVTSANIKDNKLWILIED